MNTGIRIYTELIEVFVDSGLPTGNTKPNVVGDPDYIAPSQDLVACPLPTTTTSTTTTSTTLLPPMFCAPSILVKLIPTSNPYTYQVYFETQGTNVSRITIQYSNNNTTWLNSTGSSISPRVITFPSAGLWYVRIVTQCSDGDREEVSNATNPLSVYVSSQAPGQIYKYINFRPPVLQNRTVSTKLTFARWQDDQPVSASYLQIGDTITVQVASLGSKGVVVSIQGTTVLTIPGYGFAELIIPVTSARFNAKFVELDITIPEDAEFDSYAQVLLRKINGVDATFLGTPNAIYLQTNELNEIIVTTN